MNTRYPLVLAFLATVVLGTICAVTSGKPPAPKQVRQPPPSPPSEPSVVGTPSGSSVLRWLLQQNGGTDAISTPWVEAVHAMTGKQVSPVDPADETDAAVITKVGAALDLVLPRMNRVDGLVRNGPALTAPEVAARFEEELQIALRATPGLAFNNLIDPSSSERGYPTFELVEAGSGRTYYFATTIYPAGGRDAAACALVLNPAAAASRMKTDGRCLLVGIEDNGKPGKDAAFLNWELVDLSKVTVRCAVVFETDQQTLHQPGTLLTDGRKGRD